MLRIKDDHSFQPPFRGLGDPTWIAVLRIPRGRYRVHPFGRGRCITGGSTGVGGPIFSESAGVTSEWPETPLVNDNNDLHAALVDKLKAHPGEETSTLRKKAFLEIFSNHVSRLKWKQAPVLGQWAAKVKQGTQTATGGSPTQSRQTDSRFTFNPAKYQPDEIAKLTLVYEASYKGAFGSVFRDGSDDEWRIIEGLAEGSIACRTLPSFVQCIMGSSERILLFNTIHAQVEGELVMTLQRHHHIRVTEQSTYATIFESAELVRVNLSALHALIIQTKQIAYDRVTKSIHFFLLTIETAMNHQRVAIPYRGESYSLTNPHRPHQGTVLGPSARPGWGTTAAAGGVYGLYTQFDPVS
ncbi:unnamed protein product [Peronospora belbahrii]|uniref:Uncharacterized protein n=1 Tax=Peronospora belbahrii TaxID=622444 RepID=A0ABN8CWQ0_9STRA|nr:unnamed protein product [Peronospora belbahrii]